MKKKRIALVVSLCAMLVTMLFIFGNSFDSKALSSAKSGFVLHLLKPIIEAFVGEGDVTEHLVRKLAHFTEFGVLGALLGALIVLNGKNGFQPFVNGLFIGLLAAVADETIQIFSNRGSMVADILLDFCGVICGLVAVLALRAAIRLLTGKKRQKKVRS